MTSYNDLAEEFGVPVSNVLTTFFLPPDIDTSTELDADAVQSAREAWALGANFSQTAPADTPPGSTE